MIEEVDFEIYLCVSEDKFKIFLFDKQNFTNLYKDELKIKTNLNFIDFYDLSKFLDKNIFKIEKLLGKFIKNIFLIIESENSFNLNIGIKKKNYGNSNNQKYLENTLTELKDLFKENNEDQYIMHILISNHQINEKNYSSFVNNLNRDDLCLEVNFIHISNNLVFKLDKILERYQIKIINYLDGNYIKDFFKDDDIELSEMAHKIINGFNYNEVMSVPKNIENKGFFEKFFQLFS